MARDDPAHAVVLTSRAAGPRQADGDKRGGVEWTVVSTEVEAATQVKERRSDTNGVVIPGAGTAHGCRERQYHMRN